MTEAGRQSERVALKESVRKQPNRIAKECGKVREFPVMMIYAGQVATGAIQLARAA